MYKFFESFMKNTREASADCQALVQSAVVTNEGTIIEREYIALNVNEM